MDALLQILLVAVAVEGLLVFIAAVRALGAKLDWSAEVRRKCVHIATGCFAMALPLIFHERWPVVLLVLASIATMLWMRLPSQRSSGLGSTLHSVERKSWGDVLLALAIGFLFLRSSGSPVLYVLPLAVITLSDSAAALAGTIYGRAIFRVEKGVKSFEGVAVFFFVTWLVSIIILLLLTDVERPNVILLGLAVAAFGALVEADSWNGLDNVFVPIGIYIFLRGHLAGGALDIFMLAAAFLATAVAFSRLGPRFGVTGHAARGHAIVVFILASFSGWLAACLPVVALFAHLFAREKRPCRSAYPDLDMLATFVGLACAWLFVGETVGPSALHFFMLTYAGAILVYVALAMGCEPLVSALLTVALLALYALVMEATVPASRWHGPLTSAAFVSLAVCGFAVCWRPRLFDRWRAPRVALVSSIVPTFAYFTKALLA
ncbi:diacylglycerol/polyprenol kinase family protein [Rhodoblastus sp.]|uniref:diacylglycerol/polyprenol kinase family protein n=1 Tax=Rhodoblastus sp. TaxID=1962975 RepID=UPI003F96EA6D